MCEAIEIEKTTSEGKKLGKEIPLYKYIGESARSSFERGSEHWSDMINLNQGSHILKHALQSHENDPLEEMEFGMRVLRYHYFHQTDTRGCGDTGC